MSRLAQGPRTISAESHDNSIIRFKLKSKPILTFLSIVFSILVEMELAADSILVEIELAADLIFCLIGLNSFAKSAAVIPGCAG